MGQQNTIVKQVMRAVLNIYSERMESSEQTQQSIDEAMESLGVFEADAIDRAALNQALLDYKASDLACKAAWALYKDFVQHADKAA